MVSESQSHPDVEVLAGKRSGAYTATEIADPSERQTAWAKALDIYADYDDYQVRSGSRTIPLIRFLRSRA